MLKREVHEGCRGDAHVGAFLVKPQILKSSSSSLAGLESLLEDQESSDEASGDDLYEIGTFANVSHS